MRCGGVGWVAWGVQVWGCGCESGAPSVLSLGAKLLRKPLNKIKQRVLRVTLLRRRARSSSMGSILVGR